MNSFVSEKNSIHDETSRVFHEKAPIHKLFLFHLFSKKVNIVYRNHPILQVQTISRNFIQTTK